MKFVFFESSQSKDHIEWLHGLAKRVSAKTEIREENQTFSLWIRNHDVSRLKGILEDFEDNRKLMAEMDENGDFIDENE